MIDSGVIGTNLKMLERMGVRLAIDDFGTGYSSLSYLRRYDVDSLKIDRSFIRDIEADSDEDVVTSAIIGLSRTLGMEVIAEGVETPEQYNYLKSLRCQIIQGYLVARPMPAENFVDWLAQRQVAQSAEVIWRFEDLQQQATG